MAGADGAPNPHTTQDLRNLKKAMRDGAYVSSGIHLETVGIKQGHSAHIRRKGDASVLCAAPMGHGPNNLASRVGSENFAHIARNGRDRPTYSPVAEYRILGPDPPLAPSPPAEVLHVVHGRSSSPIFPSGGVGDAVRISRACVLRLEVRGGRSVAPGGRDLRRGFRRIS